MVLLYAVHSSVHLQYFLPIFQQEQEVIWQAKGQEKAFRQHTLYSFSLISHSSATFKSLVVSTILETNNNKVVTSEIYCIEL